MNNLSVLFVFILFINVRADQFQSYSSLPFNISLFNITLPNLSKQCAIDTATWAESLFLFSKTAQQCLGSNSCSAKQIKTLQDNLFAVKQIDSFGHLPNPGLLELNLVAPGSYEECKETDGVKYDTHYCYAHLAIGKHAACNGSLYLVRQAVCMPESCGSSDIAKIYNEINAYPLTACSATCVKKHIPKDSAFWGYSIFLIVMVCIVLASTVFDYIREVAFDRVSAKETNPLFKICLAFSLYTNSGLLLSVKEPRPGHIRSLDCIRLFSMSWVVAGHTILNFLYSDEIRPLLNIRNSIWNQIFMNALVSVDTFFLLSGVVVAYLFFKDSPKPKVVKNPFTWILFYVHRYLRLTPPYMLFVGFYIVYGAYLQGPFTIASIDLTPLQIENCKKSWWKNLLYINNFGDNNNQCYGIAWYLAVDTQLYLVMPIFLIALYFSFSIGIFLILAAGVGSVITTYILMFVDELPPYPLGKDANNDFMDVLYTKPWIRGTPYLIGIVVGYFLAKYGKRKIRLNWGIAVGLWISALVVACACLFGVYDYINGAKWSRFTDATYYNFHRIGWSLAVAWVIVANHMGWGGPINNFMSHPIWQPFGRLSYCAYIVHWMVITYFLNLLDRPTHYINLWQIYLYYVIPITVIAYVCAFFWSCLFEVPILKLEKQLIEGLLGVQKGSNKVENSDVEKKLDKNATKLNIGSVEKLEAVTGVVSSQVEAVQDIESGSSQRIPSITTEEVYASSSNKTNHASWDIPTD